MWWLLSYAFVIFFMFHVANSMRRIAVAMEAGRSPGAPQYQQQQQHAYPPAAGP